MPTAVIQTVREGSRRVAAFELSTALRTSHARRILSSASEFVSLGEFGTPSLSVQVDSERHHRSTAGQPPTAEVFRGGPGRPSGVAASVARRRRARHYSTAAIISISTIASGWARPLIWIVVLVGLPTPKYRMRTSEQCENAW